MAVSMAAFGGASTRSSIRFLTLMLADPPGFYIHGSTPAERRRLMTLNDLVNASSLRALRPESGQKVLDVGAGLGQFARLVARAVGGEGRVVAVERDEVQLDEAVRLAAADGEEELVEFRLGDAVELPLTDEENGTFDIVHARFLLEHVSNPGAVVGAMLAALRPGGRIVLEDDDHDLLRLWPEVPEYELVWSAYIEAWDRLGNDPFVGRRLVRLLLQAGAEPTKNDWLFFGSCPGDADFSSFSENFRTIVAGAAEAIVAQTETTQSQLQAGLQALERWSDQPDAALWYATCWAEGRRPERPDGPKSSRGRERLLPRQQRGKTLVGIPQHTVETTGQSFESLGLSQQVVASLHEIGYEHPTPIQARVIPLALEGIDLIGLAQTGSGKTAAFCLPMADRLQQGEGVRGLILCPTREIALQTMGFLEVFGKRQGLRATVLIGGVKIEPQIKSLRAVPDILVATPGRLLDHVRRRTVSLKLVSELVLDEADHMLDLGFLPQIRAVLEAVPEERQTLMFSATMPASIERLAQRFMKDAFRVDLLPEGRAAEGIDHRLYLVEGRDKKPCLLSLVAEEPGSVLVFLRRKVDADWACRQLQIEGHPVERIHSGLSQSRRDAALQGFREGEHRVLVATDVAARGIDIPRIQHIINFDPPQSVDDYIHRGGRTARGALKGTVSTIATWDAKPFLALIEAALGHPLKRCVATGVRPYVEAKPPRTKRRRLR